MFHCNGDFIYLSSPSVTGSVTDLIKLNISSGSKTTMSVSCRPIKFHQTYLFGISNGTGQIYREQDATLVYVCSLQGGWPSGGVRVFLWVFKTFLFGRCWRLIKQLILGETPYKVHSIHMDANRLIASTGRQKLKIWSVHSGEVILEKYGFNGVSEIWTGKNTIWTRSFENELSQWDNDLTLLRKWLEHTITRDKAWNNRGYQFFHVSLLGWFENHPVA